LAKNHPIYSEQYLANKWRVHPKVEGLSNGIREMMVLIPEADISKAWQTGRSRRPGVVLSWPAIFSCMPRARKNVEHKGHHLYCDANGVANGELKLARLKVGKNWDPEREGGGGWPTSSTTNIT